MKTFLSKVGQNGATLSGYLLDSSPEYPNMDVRPAVLVCPGGGYSCCSDREAEPVALAYAGAGFNTFVLRYSVGDQSTVFPKAFEDVKAALAYLRENAQQLCIAPHRIAAIGFSAGGHLAGCLATMSEEKPDALILGYPVTLDAWGEEFHCSMPDVTQAVSEATPPTFLFATSDDHLVPVENTIAMMAALAKHHVYFESHVYLTGSHGLSLATPEVSGGNPGLVSDAVAEWLPASIKFLQNVLGKSPVAGESPVPPLALVRGCGVDAPVWRLLENAGCAALLEKELPGFAEKIEQDAMSWSITLRQMSAMHPAWISPDTLARLEKGLAQNQE